MASIQTKKRGSETKYYVVYRVKINGKRKQIWYPCEDKWAAKELQPIIAASEKAGTLYQPENTLQMPLPITPPADITIEELVENYIRNKALKWSPSTLTGNSGLAKNYINPLIGQWKISAVTPYAVQSFYTKLLNTDAVPRYGQQENHAKVSARTVCDIKKILAPAFREQIKFGVLQSNPFDLVDTPKTETKPRVRWTEEEIDKALIAAHEADNIQMEAAILTQYICTTRSGELLGLTWSDIIDDDNPRINLVKTLERCSKSALAAIHDRDIIRRFPAQKANTETVIVLKAPKTEGSVRHVYINDTLLSTLRKLREQQEQYKALLGADYHDYGLVFSLENGNPMLPGVLAKRFHTFCDKHGLKKVDLYSLRHTGCMSKLIAANGNLKAVQGDMGHSTADMLLKFYSAIQDGDRQELAKNLAKRVQARLAEE